QPFKIRRLGHFGLNVPDPAACLDFYCEGLGFRISDPLDVAEHHPKRDELKKLGDTNMYFLRHGTDHHSVVLCNGKIYNAAGRGGGFRERPPLPQIPEYQEVEKSRGQGVDFNSGFRHPEKMPAKYDVDGILLPRPFKIVRHGPVRLFCRDMKKMEAFYTGTMGF